MNVSTTEVKAKSNLGTRFVLGLRRNIQTYTLIIAVVVIWVIFYFATGGSYLDPQNISNLFRQMTVTSFLSHRHGAGDRDRRHRPVGGQAGRFCFRGLRLFAILCLVQVFSGPGHSASHTFSHLRPAGRSVGGRRAGLYSLPIWVCLPSS